MRRVVQKKHQFNEKWVIKMLTIDIRKTIDNIENNVTDNISLFGQLWRKSHFTKK